MKVRGHRHLLQLKCMFAPHPHLHPRLHPPSHLTLIPIPIPISRHTLARTATLTPTPTPTPIPTPISRRTLARTATLIPTPTPTLHITPASRSTPFSYLSRRYCSPARGLDLHFAVDAIEARLLQHRAHNAQLFTQLGVCVIPYPDVFGKVSCMCVCAY